MEVKVGIVGFGVVGQGFLRILQRKGDYLSREGLTIKVMGISDPVRGEVYNDQGLEINKILKGIDENRNLNDLGLGEVGWYSERLIEEGDIQILLEATPTNIKTGEPGYTHIRRALERGIHVATTNKGPIALFLRDLSEIASKNKVLLKYEGTVMSGTPVFNLIENTLKGLEILEIRGILNGTTNYILTLMSQGISYQDALKDAQQRGYAEADPTNDVEGFDSLAKIIILSNFVFNSLIRPDDVEREGITGISEGDLDLSISQGKKWKLIARAFKENGRIRAYVRPEMVDRNDILYNVDGVLNAVSFKTDLLGELTIVGRGAGGIEAGYALFIDLLNIIKEVF